MTLLIFRRIHMNISQRQKELKWKWQEEELDRMLERARKRDAEKLKDAEKKVKGNNC